MKIKVNYDLITKIAEAEKGYSLKQKGNRVLGLTMITIPLSCALQTGNISPLSLTATALTALSVHSFYVGFQTLLFKGINKEISQAKLFGLVKKLNEVGIKVDMNSITKSYKYAIDYSIQNEGHTIPMIEQKKYIKIPINDEWGEREIPMVQEHLIGTSDYYLSMGIYKEKTYSLGIKSVLKR